MNAPTDHPLAQNVSLPPSFQALCPPPQLLPGESIDHYQALQAAIFQDLAPHTAIEWLLAIDIAELSWEMQRYRVLRHRLLVAYRQRAVESTLRRIDVAGVPFHAHADAELFTIKNALEWQLDPLAKADIEDRLHSYGFDEHALNMEVYVQAREILALFESLLNGTQLRRLVLLKEINNLRRANKSESLNSRSARHSFLASQREPQYGK